MIDVLVDACIFCLPGSSYNNNDNKNYCYFNTQDNNMSSEHLLEDTGICPSFLARHTTDTTLVPPSQNSEHLMKVTGICPDFLAQHTTDVGLLNNSPQAKVKSNGPFVASGCKGNSASLQKTHPCGSGNRNHMHEEASKMKGRGKKEMKERKKKQMRQEAREKEKERNNREQRERCIQGERTPIQESSACQCHYISRMENSMSNCSEQDMHR